MTTETRERITDPERLSRLEGAYGHLATKADIAALETRIIKWAIGIAASLFVAMAGLTIAALTLLYRLLS